MLDSGVMCRKEFILCHATTVKKYSKNITNQKGEVSDLMRKWFGNEQFIALETNTTDGNVTHRVKLNFARIHDFNRQLFPEEIDSDPEWDHAIHPAITQML